jgi:Flp pilus assembly secretin CpaC
MSMFVRIRPSGRRFLAMALLAFGLPVSALAQEVVVTLDQAKMIRLPERTSTIVIGNPLIADASLQAGGVVVLTGKSYGATNFVALDRSGAVLMERDLRVEGPRDHEVVVYRGIAPKCERRLTPGDISPFYSDILGQTMARSTLASPAHKTDEKKN